MSLQVIQNEIHRKVSDVTWPGKYSLKRQRCTAYDVLWCESVNKQTTQSDFIHVYRLQLDTRLGSCQGQRWQRGRWLQLRACSGCPAHCPHRHLHCCVCSPPLLPRRLLLRIDQTDDMDTLSQCQHGDLSLMIYELFLVYRKLRSYMNSQTVHGFCRWSFFFR